MALLPDALPAGEVELRRWRPAFAVGLCGAVNASLTELRPWMPWAQDEPTVDGQLTVLTEGEASFDADTEWQFVMATAMLGLLPPVLVVIVMQRWFVKGLVDAEK